MTHVLVNLTNELVLAPTRRHRRLRYDGPALRRTPWLRLAVSSDAAGCPTQLGATQDRQESKEMVGTKNPHLCKSFFNLKKNRRKQENSARSKNPGTSSSEAHGVSHGGTRDSPPAVVRPKPPPPARTSAACQRASDSSDGICAAAEPCCGRALPPFSAGALPPEVTFRDSLSLHLALPVSKKGSASTSSIRKSLLPKP